MYPPSRRAALAAVLTAERAVQKLAEDALRQWAPAAAAAALPALTAAAPELPPDLSAAGLSQPEWNRILDEHYLPGLGLIITVELYAALGDTGVAAVTAAGLTAPAGTVVTVPPPLPKRTVTIVSDALGMTPARVLGIADQLGALPTTRAIQSAYLARVRNRMVDTPEQVFRDIAADLDKGIALGEGIPDQRKRVQRHLSADTGDWPGRAATVARTETAGALSHATIEAAALRNELLGEDLEQVWLATMDGKTRNSHFAADGQRIPLKGLFTVGGADLAYPGDADGPAHEVINCRCRAAILAADEPMPHERDRHTERGPGDATVINRDGSQADEIARRAADGVIRARDDEDGLGRVASAQPRGEMSMADDLIDVDVDTGTEEGSGELFRTFTDAVVAVLGTPTDDRRILAADIDLTFRDMPLPLMWTKQTGYGHEDAFTVGVIEAARVDGSDVLASGYLLNTAEADEAAAQLAHGVTGPSVDLGAAEWQMTDEHGIEVSEDVYWEALDNGEEITLYETIVAAKLLGVTLVATPAFGQTRLALDGERAARDVAVVASLLAAAAVPSYDPALFTDPGLDGPTPLTYDEATGRIYGHLACFDTCHVGFTDRCVTAPRSAVNYAHFHTSPPVRLTDGQMLPVGRLTVGAGHADPRSSAAEAAAHYDDVATCFALVRAGEDAHGIWVSGIVHPAADERTVAAGLTAPLSGDWRTIGGNLELVAALAVNTPGFPIVASGITDDTDAPLALVASLAPRKSRAAVSTAVDPAAVAAEVIKQLRAAEKRRTAAAAILADRRRAQARAVLDKVGR